MSKPNTHFLCVGQSSANTVRAGLATCGLTCKIEIAEPQNSEGLICSDALSSVSSQKIALVKGKEGRNIIAEYLTQNNAKTDIYEVYERVSAFNPTSINAVERMAIQCIIVTSVDIAEQIFQHFSSEWLQNRHFMVASQRIYDYVLANGMQQPVLSDNASTAAIVSCAQQLYLSGVLDDKGE
jgi:uroporphyrinogen-III synthase